MSLDLWSPIAFRSSEGQTSKKLQEPKCFTVGYFLQTFDSLKKCFRKKVDVVLAEVNPFKKQKQKTVQNINWKLQLKNKQKTIWSFMAV